jgi:hypothetical protein
LIKAVSEAGATCLNACALRLRSSARQRYLPFIEKEFPALASRYRATYGHSHHAGERYREGLHRYFTKVCGRYGVPFGRKDDGEDEKNEQETASEEQLPLEF